MTLLATVDAISTIVVIMIGFDYVFL